MTAKHVVAEVLKATGITMDCTKGKLYDALMIDNGMRLLNGDNIDAIGVTFFDDSGDQVAIHLSLGLVKVVQRQ